MFPAHDVHISGVLGSIELQLQILSRKRNYIIPMTITEQF